MIRIVPGNKLPTIWTDGEAEVVRVSEEKSRRKKIRGKKMQVREKGREVKAYKHTPCSEHFWKLRCRKSARRCGAKHISKSKRAKHHVRSTVGNWDVEKVHAVVARSTLPSQNVQSTMLGALLEVRCRKSARRCGAKHISMSKWQKGHMFGPRLDVQMSFRVAGAKDSAPCQKRAKTAGFCGSFNYNHQYTTLHSTPLHCNYNYNILQLSSVFSGCKKANRMWTPQDMFCPWRRLPCRQRPPLDRRLPLRHHLPTSSSQHPNCTAKRHATIGNKKES